MGPQSFLYFGNNISWFLEDLSESICGSTRPSDRGLHQVDSLCFYSSFHCPCLLSCTKFLPFFFFSPGDTSHFLMEKDPVHHLSWDPAAPPHSHSSTRFPHQLSPRFSMVESQMSSPLKQFNVKQRISTLEIIPVCAKIFLERYCMWLCLS